MIPARFSDAYDPPADDELAAARWDARHEPRTPHPSPGEQAAAEAWLEAFLDA